MTCAGNNGTASASASAGTAPYSYIWSNGMTGANISGLAAGNYVVTATAANGCSNSANVNVGNSCTPCTVNLNSNVLSNVACFGGSTGSANAVLTGGTAPYFYIWSNGATAQTASGLSAGTYTVTVSDASGCTATTGTTITQPSALASPASKTDVTCVGNNGTITLNTSGGVSPYSYLWNNSATTASISGLAPGSYSATTTDANGCSIVTNVSIINTCSCAMTATASTLSNVNCNGNANGVVTVSSTGGVNPLSYSWSNGANTQTVSGLSGAVYNVTVTGLSGCSATASTTVTEPVALVATISSNIPASCNGYNDGSLSVAPSGGQTPYSYSWSNGGTTNTINNLSAGNYTITVTGSNGCSATNSATVSQPSAITITVSSTDETCSTNDGTATAVASGGTAPYTFNWSNGGNTSTIANLNSGLYTMTITDATGCIRTSSVIVGDTCSTPCLWSLTATVTNNALCFNQSNGIATCTPTGAGGSPPYNFAWSNGSFAQDATGLSAGVYTVTAVDVLGCTKMATVTITQPTVLAISTSNSNETCIGNNGTASANLSGGTSPYSYLWSNTATAQTATGLAQGSYSLTASDANGCTTSATTTVAFNNTLSSQAVVNQQVSCAGYSDGSAQVQGLGFSPITYLWNNGFTGTTATGLSAGIYTVTVTGGICTRTHNLTVTEPAAMNLNLVATHSACVQNTGQVTATVSGGGGAPYLYLWSNGAVSSSISGLGSGTYTVTVTTSMGCVSVSSASINIAIGPTMSSTTTSPSCFGLRDGALDLSVTGPGNYQFLWNNGATTEDLMGIGTGIFTVLVSDTTVPCTVSYIDTVRGPAPLTASFSTTQPSTPAHSNGAVTLAAAGGISPYTYIWNTGSTNNQLLGIGIGEYFVTITDANGCTHVDSITVTAFTAISITSNSIQEFSIYPNPNSGQFTVHITLLKHQNLNLRLQDVLGRILFETEISGLQIDYPMDLDRYPPGSYFISLQTADELHSRKIIIAR